MTGPLSAMGVAASDRFGNPGALVSLLEADHIVIAPRTASIAAGASRAYATEAFDQYNNSLGDVTDSTSFSIDLGAGGHWSANVYTSEKAGTWTVIGTYGGKADTATLSVNPPNLTVTSVNPNQGYQGRQNETVTITGTR